MVELAALDYLRQLGWTTAFGSATAPGMSKAERTSYEHVYLYGRLRAAVARINPGIAPSVLDEAVNGWTRGVAERDR